MGGEQGIQEIQEMEMIEMLLYVVCFTAGNTGLNICK